MEARDRIIEVLRDREDAVSEYELCESVAGPGLYDALDELVHEGVVGRSYWWENEFPEESGLLQVGRVYRVWLRTPQTAERDREILRRADMGGHHGRHVWSGRRGAEGCGVA